MLIDFDKVFSNPELQDSMPDGYIDLLNASAPANTHYERIDKDCCILRSNEGTITWGGLVFCPTKRQREVLGDNFTPEDFSFYLYNSQTQYQFRLAEPGKILVNDEKIDVNDLGKSLHRTFRVEEGSIFMSAEPMNDSFNTKVGDGTITHTLHMVRKPNDSISEILFESDDSTVFKMSIRCDLKNPKREMTYTVKMGHADTITKMLESMKLYNAFASGNAYIDGKSLGEISDFKGASPLSESDIIFWEKVVQIEKKLDLHFVPVEGKVSMVDVTRVELLYQSLIKKNPTRYNKRIDSLKGTNINKEVEGIVKENLGKPMFIEFTMKEEFDLFGEHIELLGFISLCNAILDECIIDGDTAELKFRDESEDKKLFATMLLFDDVDEFEKYREGDSTERAAKLQDAKYPLEYM